MNPTKVVKSNKSPLFSSPTLWSSPASSHSPYELCSARPKSTVESQEKIAKEISSQNHKRLRLSKCQRGFPPLFQKQMFATSQQAVSATYSYNQNSALFKQSELSSNGSNRSDLAGTGKHLVWKAETKVATLLTIPLVTYFMPIS